jgi:hypothetical protein
LGYSMYSNVRAGLIASLENSPTSALFRLAFHNQQCHNAQTLT